MIPLETDKIADGIKKYGACVRVSGEILFTGSNKADCQEEITNEDLEENSILEDCE
jgi:hypothetical protein